MSHTSGIEWTDATWNPVRGCSIVSKGCTNCYAMKQAHRFAGAGKPYEGLTQMTRAGPVWNGQIRLVRELLDWPLQRRKPLRIFVNSMSDLFHDDVPWEFIDAVFAVMAVTTRHTYQVLTKRPRRMLEYMRHLKLDPIFGFPDRISHRASDIRDGYDNCGPPWPLENVWLGVSVEDQATADERIPLLLQTPAAVRWISAEPLLGDLRLGSSLQRSPSAAFIAGKVTAEMPEWTRIGSTAIDWVVAGGESGHKARPTHPDWIRSLRDECATAGVSFFFKQWGEWQEVDGEARDPETGDHLRVDVPSREADDTFDPKSDCLISQDGVVFKSLDGLPAGSPCRLMTRIGKRAAGRLLDGQLHNEYPASPLTITKESP